MLCTTRGLARHCPIILASSLAHTDYIIRSWLLSKLTEPRLDRLLSDYIHRYILDPAILPTALRNLRGALFPNNAMGTQTLFPPESDQELHALRRRCASATWALCPRSIGRLYFGGSGPSWLAAAFSNNKDNDSDNPALAPPAVDSQRSGPAAEDAAASAAAAAGGGHDFRAAGDPPDAAILAAIETDILDVFSDPYCNKHLIYGALELILVRLMPELVEKGVAELWEERLS